MKRISPRGIALIKEFEGLRLKAYRDAVGVLTIGYGHTGPDVRDGLVITQRAAEKLLREDLSRFEAGVANLVTAPVTQNMFDALTSLAFNIGIEALTTSTVIQRLNARDYAGAARAFTWWNRAGGRKLNGLVRRRAAEAELFLKGADKAFAAPLPAALALNLVTFGRHLAHTLFRI